MKVKKVSLKPSQIAMGQSLYFAEPQTGYIHGTVISVRRTEDVIAHGVSIAKEYDFPKSADPSVFSQHPLVKTSDHEAIRKEMDRNPEYAEYVNRILNGPKDKYHVFDRGVLVNYDAIGKYDAGGTYANVPGVYAFLVPYSVKNTVFKVRRADNTIFEIGANELNREEFATRVFRKAKHAVEYVKRPVLTYNGEILLETNLFAREIEEEEAEND